MSKIKQVKAREILNSRSIPTIEVKIELENGVIAKASVPSGSSTGEWEAHEIRDKDLKRFNGKGVESVVFNVNKKIGPEIKGLEPNPKKIDDIMLELDGSENKSQLGSNAILGVSLATARVSAKDQNIPLYKFIRYAFNLPDLEFRLPTPLLNVINGGLHANSGLDVQEHSLVPIGPNSFSKKLQIGVEAFWALKRILENNELNTGVGYEGGFAPKLGSTIDVFDMLIRAVELAHLKIGDDIYFALDVAAS